MSSKDSVIREKIKKEILFLSDHWTTEDRTPFNFGGWLEEVVDELVNITNVARLDAKREVIEEIKDKFVHIAIEGRDVEDAMKGLTLYTRTLEMLEALKENHPNGRKPLELRKECMCHCHTEEHPIGRYSHCPPMSCIHCKKEWVSDLQPFKHGEESTHYACDEMLASGCCACTRHKCKKA